MDQRSGSGSTDVDFLGTLETSARSTGAAQAALSHDLHPELIAGRW
jgi:hypothetical protein